jgi:8-oxo-dGTP diphosphatase
MRHERALVAVYVGSALLLVRSSYRRAWNLPGGSVRRGETPEATAARACGGNRHRSEGRCPRATT